MDSIVDPALERRNEGWLGGPGPRAFAREMVASWTRWDEDGRSQGSSDATIAAPPRDAVAFLLDQRRTGFPEAVHMMPLPHATSAGIAWQSHPASLFQRAVVTDALLDARDAGLTIPRRDIDEEVLSLLRAKHRLVAGGWSYVPELPNLPPDADDLAAVLRVLSRAGGVPLAAACETPIRLALAGVEPDGGIPTFIVDPHDGGLGEAQISRYLEIIGGRGPHAEVTANLLSALHLHDPVRFRAPIIAAREHFARTRDWRGYWPSHWYAGPYYGTFRVASILPCVEGGRTMLDHALDSILDDQARDGGWGRNGSNPLDTSFALLTLAIRGDAPAARERAVDYLARSQQSDGGWMSVVWERFPTPIGTLTYGSRTVTTAFALKAWIASQRCAVAPERQ